MSLPVEKMLLIPDPKADEAFKRKICHSNFHVISSGIFIIFITTEQVSLKCDKPASSNKSPCFACKCTFVLRFQFSTLEIEALPSSPVYGDHMSFSSSFDGEMEKNVPFLSLSAAIRKLLSCWFIQILVS